MKYILLLLIFFSLNSHSKSYSTTLTYQSSFEQSKWLVNKSKLHCEIKHTVHNFGVAHFSKMAGERLYTFIFDFYAYPKTITKASVYLYPNHWQSLAKDFNLFKVDIYEGYNIELKDKNVDLVLQYLQQGYKIGFLYTDQQRVNFILNQVDFNTSYLDFISCVDNLLPYSFKDIQNMVLNFKNNSLELTKQSQNKFDKILKYIQEDQDFKSIQVNAYSDSYGGFNS